MATDPTTTSLSQGGHVIPSGQLRCLLAIQAYQERHGYPPTYRNLLAILGLGEKNYGAIQGHLDALERKGLIRREFDRPRAITLLVRFEPVQ